MHLAFFFGSLKIKTKQTTLTITTFVPISIRCEFSNLNASRARKKYYVIPIQHQKETHTKYSSEFDECSSVMQ